MLCPWGGLFCTENPLKENVIAVWWILKMLDVESTCGLAIPLPGTYPKELKAGS